MSESTSDEIFIVFTVLTRTSRQDRVEDFRKTADTKQVLTVRGKVKASVGRLLKRLKVGHKKMRPLKEKLLLKVESKTKVTVI